MAAASGPESRREPCGSYPISTLRQYESAPLVNLLCFVFFPGEIPISPFLSLSLLSGSRAWCLSSSTVWRKEPGNSIRSARLNLHSVFQTTLCLHPTHHPLCTAYLHSKCLMLNLSGIPGERTNNLSEWHKDYIKVKIPDLQVQKEIFLNFWLKLRYTRIACPKYPSQPPHHHSREVSSQEVNWSWAVGHFKANLYKQTSSEPSILWSPAAAAKSLQSCPTLCDPIDSSPPGSSVPGILQARILEWTAIYFSIWSRKPP